MDLLDEIPDPDDIHEWARSVVRKRVRGLIEERELRETEDIVCQVCHKGDRADVLLVCDHCNLGFHIDCLNPPLSEVPPGQWICPLCPDYADIDSDDGSLDDDAQEVDPPNEPFASHFVNSQDTSCQACLLEVATRFVLNPDDAAPDATSQVSFPGHSQWLCESCALPVMRECVARQKAALEKLMPQWRVGLGNGAPAAPPSSEKKEEEGGEEKGKKKNFRALLGPAMDRLLSYAMERCGALKKRRCNWSLIQRHYFGTITPKRLAKHFHNRIHRAPHHDVLRSLEERREAPKKKRQSRREKEDDAVVQHGEEVRSRLQHHWQGCWEGTQCPHCGQKVRGTMRTCGECGMQWCLRCCQVVMPDATAAPCHPNAQYKDEQRKIPTNVVKKVSKDLGIPKKVVLAIADALRKRDEKT